MSALPIALLPLVPVPAHCSDAQATFDAPSTTLIQKLQTQVDSWQASVSKLKQSKSPTARDEIAKYQDAIESASSASAYLSGGTVAQPQALKRIKEVVRWESRPVWVVC